MDLTQKKCVPCEGGVAKLTGPRVAQLLESLPGWALDATQNKIHKRFAFKNFYHTLAFVNGVVAWIAHRENHHPDLTLGYNYCEVNYTTHAVQGLTENDFICAARIEALLNDDAKSGSREPETGSGCTRPT